MQPVSTTLLTQAQAHVQEIRSDVRSMIHDYRRQRAVHRSHELVDDAKQRLLQQAKTIIQKRSEMVQSMFSAVRSGSCVEDGGGGAVLTALCAALEEDFQQCKVKLLVPSSISSDAQRQQAEVVVVDEACAFQPVLHVLCSAGQNLRRFESPLTRDIFLLSDDDFTEMLFGSSSSSSSFATISSVTMPAGDGDSPTSLVDTVESFASGEDARTSFLASLLATKRALSSICKDAKFIPVGSAAEEPGSSGGGACGTSVRWPLICRMENLFYCVATVIGIIVEHEIKQALLVGPPTTTTPPRLKCVFPHAVREWDDVWGYCWKYVVLEKFAAVGDAGERRRRTKVAFSWYSLPELGLSEQVLREAKSSLPEG